MPLPLFFPRRLWMNSREGLVLLSFVGLWVEVRGAVVVRFFIGCIIKPIAIERKDCESDSRDRRGRALEI
jgi:hypothetical protein